MPHRPNGTYVSNSDALTAWTPLARDILLTTAQSYHAVITDEQLAAEVQQRSGILHDQPAGLWIDKLLDRVTAETRRREEPPLAALCIGGSDDRVKADRRLQCYRAYATDLPADGGIPDIQQRLVAAPRPRTAAAPRIRPAATPSLREVTCPSCWMIVAARPTCSSCGAALEA
jgi:hypothetical protein